MILMKWDGIKGDSETDGHKEEIQLSEVKFGVGRAIGATAAGTDRQIGGPAFSEVSVSKLSDIASTNLFIEAACGIAQKKAVVLSFIQLSGPSKKPEVFMQVYLFDAIISSYNISSSGERPSESLTISYTKIVFEYTQLKEGKDPVKADPKGFNLKTGLVDSSTK